MITMGKDLLNFVHNSVRYLEGEIELDIIPAH
jgi:hypothetical protein